MRGTKIRNCSMICKANLRDVPAIHALLKHWADKSVLMPRSMSDICDDLRDFVVYEKKGKVIGCAALHLTWMDLAEVRSVAVDQEHQNKGIGAKLVETCLAEARRLEVPRVFILTFVPRYFSRFGFKPVPKETFPHKIWVECVNCKHFPDCTEVAMELDLTGSPPRKTRAPRRTAK